VSDLCSALKQETCYSHHLLCDKRVPVYDGHKKTSSANLRLQKECQRQISLHLHFFVFPTIFKNHAHPSHSQRHTPFNLNVLIFFFGSNFDLRERLKYIDWLTPFKLRAHHSMWRAPPRCLIMRSSLYIWTQISRTSVLVIKKVMERFTFDVCLFAYRLPPSAITSGVHFGVLEFYRVPMSFLQKHRHY